MKAYTSLEQSKKLAEILPLESADMYWSFGNIKFMDNDYDSNVVQHIPAWSLAALLEVIPQEIFNGEYVINITEGCNKRWVLTYDHYENRNHLYYSLSIGADNLVDACHKLILKLNELNLL